MRKYIEIAVLVILGSLATSGAATSVYLWYRLIKWMVTQ